MLVGLNAKLYVGVAGSTPTTEVTRAQDVTWAPEPIVASAACREANGWEDNEVAGFKGAISFTLKRGGSDAPTGQIRDAFYTGTPLAFKVIDKVGGEGVDADFIISKFEDGQPLQGALTYTVELLVNLALRVPAKI